MGTGDTNHNKYQTGGLQHLLASQIQKEVGDEIFEKFFKFTIVRNHVTCTGFVEHGILLYSLFID